MLYIPENGAKKAEKIMNKIEYFKYLLTALKDGSKYLKVFINVIVSLLFFVFLSRTRFVPSGLGKEVIHVLNNKNFLFKEKKTGDRKYYTSEPIVYEKLKNKLVISSEILKKQVNSNIIILIIAESLGKHEGITMFNKLESQLKNSINKSIKQLGKKEYKLISMNDTIATGGTLSAELNFLCSFSYKEHLSVLYNANRLNKDNFKQCIPNLYKQYGYETFYIHTAGLDLFARQEIMPILGFDQVYSPSEAKESFEPLENIFRCITKIYCAKPDQSTFEYVKQYLNSNSNKNLFITILTVDAHGPYRSRSLKKQNEIEIYKNIASNSIKQISKFIEDILSIDNNNNISFIITSDHPPTLTSLTNKYPQKLKRYNFSFLIHKN